ncbi:MAG: response regulator [Marinilabiliales bacterium]|nr:MAG: response regulator [Marinilabiliales bacterium]
MRIKALIVDDEELARSILTEYLKSYPGIEVAGEFADGFSALKAVRELKPDLVFLDVQMPKLTGFEMLELLDDAPEIIFTTAYDQYAIRAFEINAVDYLLKPFSEERFREAVGKAVKRLGEKNKPVIEQLKSHLDKSAGIISRVVVRSGGRIRVIPVEQIAYIEALDDYVMIYTETGRFIKQKTMKFFDNHLPGDEFIRVHRSYIVKAGLIEKIEPYGKSSWVVVLKGPFRVPVSRSGYTLLKEVLDI